MNKEGESSNEALSSQTILVFDAFGSQNSLKSVNNYPANRRSCINSSSSLSSGSPAPPPSAITTTTTIRSESKLFNHPICNYNQTYGTVSTSQLSQLHS
ncbi:unnamed protein product, partial [Trichobilharzia regenti]